MKILVVHNDLMELTVIQQVLQSNKHEVIVAGNSDSALRMLQDDDIRFVIAERATTDIDEREFIKRLREVKPGLNVYILLITPKVQDAEVSTLRSGADDYLYKPVAPIELKSRVQIGERILALGSDLLESKKALESTAMFDPLTNMLNPKAFLSLAYGEIERARRNQAPISVLALAINNLDEIKARHGDAVGRDVLVVIAQAIRERSRPYDNVGLFDNSIFMIPLPYVIGQEAKKIAARLYMGVANTQITLLDGTSVAINIGIGIVSSSSVTATTEMETLIEQAKKVLERIQRTGGNQVDMIFV